MAGEMMDRVPEQYLNPQTARALTLPSAILLAGAGASVAIVAGAPIALAALCGAACWAGRVALALPRRARKERINPAGLAQPWKTFVRDAMAASDRFNRAVDQTAPGPLRDRLRQVAGQVATATRECWNVARKGEALDRAVAELDIDDVRRQLAETETDARRAGPGSDIEATAGALRHQLESAERLATVAQQTRDRLRRLDAQLDEAVARAIELSLPASDAGALGPLGSDVDSLVTELESLRQALEETARP
ncbi:MAG TPA: hypothetical protein VM121_11780 [Acidimicrobiales bacterium]|nr:hypothetical protein [Acidimicrobiales bacterium]